MTDRKRIIVAMSGGVDSSCTAALLRRQGHDVTGIGLRFPDAVALAGDSRSCCGIAGMDDARRVAHKLDIPFYVLNYKDVFEHAIIDYFCRSYREGCTPNPCVECNRVVKFGRLLDLATALGADAIATGHYARICRDDDTGRYLLKKGIDPEKDQSYFLYPLTQEQLSRTLFPLGGRTKTETRALASSFGLSVCDKPGSQDICFVGDGDYRRFLAERLPETLRPGPIVDTYGRTLGEHHGIAFYTIGQRKGLGIAAAEPLYVVSVDPASNTVVVGGGDDLLTTRISVKDVNWIAFEYPPAEQELSVKIRYRQEGLPATVSSSGGGAIVTLSSPQAAAAPGQSAVFYDGDTVVGGGIIGRD